MPVSLPVRVVRRPALPCRLKRRRQLPVSPTARRDPNGGSRLGAYRPATIPAAHSGYDPRAMVSLWGIP
jgi:hypothetical protein